MRSQSIHTLLIGAVVIAVALPLLLRFDPFGIVVSKSPKSMKEKTEIVTGAVSPDGKWYLAVVRHEFRAPKTAFGYLFGLLAYIVNWAGIPLHLLLPEGCAAEPGFGSCAVPNLAHFTFIVGQPELSGHSRVLGSLPAKGIQAAEYLDWQDGSFYVSTEWPSGRKPASQDLAGGVIIEPQSGGFRRLSGPIMRGVRDRLLTDRSTKTRVSVVHRRLVELEGDRVIRVLYPET